MASAERRAYKHAVYTMKDEHGALDIVQDAMLKLAEKYSAKPAEELPMLFQRILQNTINDYFRRQKIRSFWTVLFSSLTPSEDETLDPIEAIESEVDGPSELLGRAQVASQIEKALESLPLRQRQAFLLRYWEEMDVAETAKAMGCSEGSVKTHCSRATHALAEFLKSKGIEL